MAYKVSGTVLDAVGNPANSMIAVYTRATGALIGRCDSNISLGGTWLMDTPNNDPVFVVKFTAPVIATSAPFFYGPGVPTANAEIYDNVVPVFYDGTPLPA